jgi:hypothetical protein
MQSSISKYGARLVMLVLACGSVMAQEHEGRAIVVGAGYGVGWATADFSSIEGYEGFSDGNTGVTHAGVGISFPIGEGSSFSLITRGEYVYTTAQYSHDLSLDVLFPGDSVPGIMIDQRKLEYSTSDIGIELLALYTPAGGFGVAAGVTAGFRSVGEWEMVEQSPYPLWYSWWGPSEKQVRDDGRTLVLDDGITRTFNPIFVGLLGSIIYSFPIDSRLAMVYAINTRYDLLSPHTATTARNLSVGGEMSLRFGF